MDPTTSPALIIVGALVLLAVMFRNPIARRIEGGASPELSLEPGKATRLLADNGMARASERPANSRLQYLTPWPDAHRFRTIELPRQRPLEFYAWSSAPVGTFIIDRIPFFLHPVADDTRRLLGHTAINIQPSDDNAQSIVDVPAAINDVTAVHFLLSAGNGWITWDGVLYKGKRIGSIELVFADQSTQRIEMILGVHIREWAFGNSPNLVTHIDYNMTRPAWVSYDHTRRIDRMSIVVKDGPKDLKSIRVAAQFEIERLDRELPLPSIIISAITCERKA